MCNYCVGEEKGSKGSGNRSNHIEQLNPLSQAIMLPPSGCGFKSCQLLLVSQVMS